MGKVHGSLARAGKVKSQTPKVEKQEKPKTPKGRAHKRMLYNRRYVSLAHNQLRQRRGHSWWQAPHELERGQVSELLWARVANARSCSVLPYIYTHSTLCEAGPRGLAALASM